MTNNISLDKIMLLTSINYDSRDFPYNSETHSY